MPTDRLWGSNMGVFCGWGSIVFAVVAAALWFWASKVTVTAQPVDPPGDSDHPNDMIWVDSQKGMQIVTQAGSTIVNVLETARAQSRWNSYAALAAAMSAALQAFALYMSPTPPG